MEQSYTGVEKVGFLEMEANVMTDPVVEDSVLDRMKAQGRYAVSVNGDDIYEYKFTRMFDEQIHTDGESILIVEQADELSVPIVKDFITDPNGPDLIVWHIIGVDHAQHNYGRDHKITKNSVTRINGYMEQLFDWVDDNTTVVIFGDHGCTANGKHGGKELETRLTIALSYSKGTPFRYPHRTEMINGTSLAPIIATVSGAQFPFMNEGVWIPDFSLYDPSLPDQEMYEDMLA